ncbi:hypothetical protein, partial [Sabulibacter ruber]|uniref:hypothetical protein n=1 Tax=Sabulibacter ruber TaxID=2811901 RepID=UPI001A95BE0F
TAEQAASFSAISGKAGDLLRIVGDYDPNQLNLQGGVTVQQASGLPAFGNRHVEYVMNADHGYGMIVSFDLDFDGTEFTVQSRIHFTGNEPASNLLTWEHGSERGWNDKYSLSDGTNAYDIKVDVMFVGVGEASAADYNVAVHNSN